MEIRTVNKEEFKREIASTEIVLVDFSATWCAPCKALGKELEEFANENENVKIIKIDVDAEQELAIQYGIVNVPTLIVFKNGEVLKRKVGFIKKEAIKELMG